MPHSHPHSLRSVCRKLRRANSPSMRAGGFTLVELLVVIGIIGAIAALSVPVVMRALARARNAAIKAEIDMLHMALMNYKNEYGSFPPCLSPSGAYGPAAQHIQRIFPRTANLAAQVPIQITTLNSISWWLSGYTSDPSSPIIPTGSRKKLFEFDMTRVNQTTRAYFPRGKSDSPYLYVNAATYASLPYDVVNAPNVFGAMRQTYAGDATPFTNVGTETNDWFNADTFQIICAGRDEIFGNDDDLSNFWPGTRKEYQDSLND